MSHVEPGPLAGYNSLLDPHLAGYFSNTRMRRHLHTSGLVSRRGEIVSENTYRLNMARKEHKKHVRDLMAQAIVHKTLDMERNRQVAIKQKLEEIAKIELVRRVRTETGRKGDEDILPYLSPRSAGSGRRSRPSSVPAGSGRANSRKRSKSPASDQGATYMDENGYIVEESSPRPHSGRQSRGSSAGRGRRAKSGKRSSKYPKGELDDRHLYALDQTALRQYTMQNSGMDQLRGPSPYTMNQMPPDMASPQPTPPPRGSPRRGRRQTRPTTAQGKPVKPKSNKGTLMLHRVEPAMKHQERVQTLCDVHMHYFGSNLQLDYEKFDPRDEVTVEQQHCGGNTLYVFKEKILPGSDFCFTSRRHRGYPFSLTFYVNGVLDCRLSTCCEFKHASGSRLGGAKGHFGVLGVDGGQPCYRCQLSEGEPKQKKEKQKKQKEKEDELKVPVEEDENATERDGGVAVRGEGEEGDCTTGRGNGIEVEVKQHEDTTNEDKEEGNYDDDFEDEKGSARSRSRSSSRSSRSRSRSSSSSSSRSYSSDDSRTDKVPSPPAPVKPVQEDKAASEKNSSGSEKEEATKAPEAESFTTARSASSSESERESEGMQRRGSKSSSSSSSSGSDRPVYRSAAVAEPRSDEGEDHDTPRPVSPNAEVESVEGSQKVAKDESDDGRDLPYTYNGYEQRGGSTAEPEPVDLERATKSPSPDIPRIQTPSPEPVRVRSPSPPQIQDDRKSVSSRSSSSSSSSSSSEDSEREPETPRATSVGDTATDAQDSERESSPPPLEHKAASPQPAAVEPETSSAKEEGFPEDGSGQDTLTEAVAGEMEKVLQAKQASTESDSDSSGSSSSSSSSEESDSEDETPRDTAGDRQTEPVSTTKARPAHDPAVWSTPDVTDTEGPTVTESEDQAGGRDPENVAGDGPPRPLHLSTIGASTGLKHEGSIRPLVEGKQEVDLSSYTLTEDQVSELSQCLRKQGGAEMLVLRNCGVTDAGLGKISQALSAISSASANDLKMLNLNCNKVTASGIKHLVAIMEAKPELEILLLHGNPFGDEGISDLIEGLLDQQVLGFMQGSLSPEELEAVRGTASALTMDVVKDVLLGLEEEGGDSESEDVQRLREVVQGAASRGSGDDPSANGLRLRQLDLGDCGMTSKGAESVARLVRANVAVSSLSLTGNKEVGMNGWLALAQALRDNTNIHTLSLDYNHLGDEGVSVLAQALRDNATITALDLEGNNVGDRGAQSLLDLLRANTRISDVTLMPGNNISDSLLQEIRDLLKTRA